MSTTAQNCLQELWDEAVNNKEIGGSCTLTYWRLSNTEIWNALRDFCTAPEWKMDGADENACREETQLLFSKLNQAMVDQERTLLWPNEDIPQPQDNQWSVVFGGKWSSNPISISETLVGLLAASTKFRVYTVSRTSIEKSSLPENVVHFAKQNLDSPGGREEFEQVIARVMADYDEAHKYHEKSPLVFYFTLGQHKGHNPFVRNISGAKNFAQTLSEIVSAKLTTKSIPWKIVITGTDATNPSTKADSAVVVNGISTTVPTYKIMPYNFVYAASKLCQYYVIGAAISDAGGISIAPLLTERDENDGSMASLIGQLESFVHFSGKNGTYQDNHILGQEELDQISTHWDVVEAVLRKYLQVARGISICYTPLHRDPWIQSSFEQCAEESQGSPKAYIIQQIVRRFKNAISIDKAARAHL